MTHVVSIIICFYYCRNWGLESSEGTCSRSQFSDEARMWSRQSDSSAYTLRGSKVVEWVKIEPGAENSWTVKTCLTGSYDRHVLDILQLDSIFKLERIWEQSPAQCSQQEAVSTAVERCGDRDHSVLPEKTLSSPQQPCASAEPRSHLHPPSLRPLGGQGGLAKAFFFFSMSHSMWGPPQPGMEPAPPHTHTCPGNMQVPGEASKQSPGEGIAVPSAWNAPCCAHRRPWVPTGFPASLPSGPWLRRHLSERPSPGSS